LNLFETLKSWGLFVVPLPETEFSWAEILTGTLFKANPLGVGSVFT